VFDVVGIAALVVAFVERSGMDQHPHQGGALGPLTLADDIAHAVVELAEDPPIGRLDVAIGEIPVLGVPALRFGLGDG
jgi:hypothetical protein